MISTLCYDDDDDDDENDDDDDDDDTDVDVMGPWTLNIWTCSIKRHINTLYKIDLGNGKPILLLSSTGSVFKAESNKRTFDVLVWSNVKWELHYMEVSSLLLTFNPASDTGNFIDNFPINIQFIYFGRHEILTVNIL